MTSVPLCRYSRMRRSGRVASEKTGCSIVPKSPLGAGSRKSQKKNSPCNGPLSGAPGAAVILFHVTARPHRLVPALFRVSLRGFGDAERIFPQAVGKAIQAETSGDRSRCFGGSESPHRGTGVAHCPEKPRIIFPEQGLGWNEKALNRFNNGK